MVHVTQVTAGRWVGVALATWIGGADSTGTLHGQSAPAAERGAAAVRARTVAVVPFANLSGDPVDDWLGLGIAETIIADLQQFPALSIIGREATRDLGASWVVAGGFQRLGDQLRITARIVEVETGATHETAKVDGHFGDVFALQDRIVRELSSGFRRIAGTPAVKPRGRRRGRSAEHPAESCGRHGRSKTRGGAGRGFRCGTIGESD